MSNLLDKLKDIVSELPIDQFISVDENGCCFVDWERIDASDFKDHASTFASVMREIKALQMTEEWGK